MEVSLNGPWEYQVVKDLSSGPPTSGWTPFTVPGMVRGYDYERAWFRRFFTAPASLQGRRVKLEFGGVKFNSQVQVNGKPVGGCLGGYEPFAVDVTGALRFDGPNELLVGCHDWTGVFTGAEVDFRAVRGGSQLRQMPRDKILSPVGGVVEMYGIWDDVTLVAHEPVYIKDLFIKPSVRQGELVVDYTFANESSADAELDLRAAVEDAGQDVLLLGNARVRIDTGKTFKHSLRAKWPHPDLWSNVDPHLYHLRSSLSTGDEVRTRFGFREFWIEGHNFLLNGKKIHLLATSGWPSRGRVQRDTIRRTWEGVKAAGCVAFRTHTQPWRRIYYDVADEVGLLIIIEGAVFNDDETYRIHDPVFWDNHAGHLQARVRNHKNHPSMVMWSLENEFWGNRLNDASPPKADLMRMGRLVKQWDPTRPMFYESDGDPGGVADVIGIHYPHEYPFYTAWPDESWWLGQPKELGHRFNNGEPVFFWRKDKPLYIGEFLWIPSHDPSWNTVFLGDPAYLDYQRQRNVAKAESWKMQILGYRHFAVSGMCPWTMMQGGALKEDGSCEETNPLSQAVHYAYQPVAAFSHDFDRRFYAGDKVHRRVEVFHDVPDASDLTLAWTLTANGQVVDRGRKELRLGTADQQMLDTALSMPDAQQRMPVEWRLTLIRDNRRMFEDTQHYAVFPRPALPQVAARLGLFDPAGRTRALFEANGLRSVPVAALDKLDAGLELLVIGAGSLRAEPGRETIIGREHPQREALLEFVRKGGRLLVLEQEGYPEGLFDFGLSGQQSTMTFPLRPSHPALREDVYWLGESVTTGWSTTPRAVQVADGIFTKSLEGKPAKSYEIEEWKLTGSIVERRDPGVTFATAGTATAAINFPETGGCIVGVVARGTPCLGTYPVIRVTIECETMTPDPKLTQFRQSGGHAALGANGIIRTRIEVAHTGTYTMGLVAAGSQAEGVYPLVHVHVDGRKAGSIQLTQGGWRAYPLDLELTQGTHELGLAFVNDRYLPGVADRNVQMDKVVFFGNWREGGLAAATIHPVLRSTPRMIARSL